MAEQDAGRLPIASGTGHLGFYEAHQISPVQYQAKSVDEHLDRRDSLYRCLGLPPVAFKGARVLEVAAGSGQNSLYVAACGPASLDLVEPNPTGRNHIEEAYATFGRAHTKPVLHAARLQDFNPPETFDIVICEGWLGSLPSELELIRKLATFVSPGGVLLLTVVPFSGFFANTMRKLLALRLMPPDANFEEKTRLLVDVFGPHLSTMQSMTRSHAHWVQDCMINPHYLNVVLPLDDVLRMVGADLEVLATFPRFDVDWRWFKGLVGEKRQFNRHCVESYHAYVLNFIDHNSFFPRLEPVDAQPLNQAFADLHQAALDYQDEIACGEDDGARVSEALERLSKGLDRLAPMLSAPLEELKAVWSRPALRPENVRDMKLFGPIFGRETVYVSLTRPRD